METVSGMDCKVSLASYNIQKYDLFIKKVFGANNVEIVTKTRTEHMSAEDKQRAKANKNPLLSIFGPQVTRKSKSVLDFRCNRRRKLTSHQAVPRVKHLELHHWPPNLLTSTLPARRKRYAWFSFHMTILSSTSQNLSLTDPFSSERECMLNLPHTL